MNLFENLSQNEYVFNFNAKEEPALFAAGTDLFKSLPQDYLLIGEMKYHSLFDKDHEINGDVEKYHDSSFKWASHEILRNEINLEHSFIPIDFKTDNVAQRILEARDLEVISSMSDEKIWKLNTKYDNQSGELNYSKLDWDDNQTTQLPNDRNNSKAKAFLQQDSEPKRRGPRRMKFSRWSKDDDKKLYKTLLNLVAQNKISNKFIENAQEIDLFANSKEIKIVANLMKWKNPLPDLLKRIQKILNSSTFSVRELMALKRIIRQRHLTGPIDYEFLMLEFPGKSRSTIEKEWKKALQSIQNQIKYH